MIVDWFRELFNAHGFMTRNHCGPWSQSLMRIYIASNGLIALAFILVAVCLYLIGRKRGREIAYGWLLPCFASVFAACGLTHVCDIAVFCWPGYRLFTAVNVLTAILAVSAAVWLPRLTKILLDMPGPSVFQRVNRELQQAIALKERAINESRETIVALRRQVDHLERMRQTGLWVAEQESALRELKTVLESSVPMEVPR